MMKVISSEAVSDEYIHINRCGCQHLCGVNVGALREKGRVDYHMLYIERGCCYVTLDGKTQAAGEGSVILFLPGERQEYKFYEDTDTISYYVHFSGTLCEPLLGRLKLLGGRIYDIGKSASLTGLFEQMTEEFRIKLPFYQESCRGLLIAILSCVGRKADCTQVTTSSMKSISQVCKYINSSIAKKQPIAEYAKMCNLSESRFSHIFKEVTGVSVVGYINAVRLERAKELLSETDLPMSDVSDLLGMKNLYYFSRFFKKNTGVSPTEYRKNYV